MGYPAWAIHGIRRTIDRETGTISGAKYFCLLAHCYLVSRLPIRGSCCIEYASRYEVLRLVHSDSLAVSMGLTNTPLVHCFVGARAFRESLEE